MLKIKHTKNGFTLIEIMVAVTIFAIVSLIVSAVMVSLSAASRRVQNILSATDNLSFTLNSMEIRLREGYGATASGDQTSVTFTDHFAPSSNQTDKIITYGWDKNKECVSEIIDNDASHPVCLTSDQITVNKLAFYVNQYCSDCNNTITIVLEAITKKDPRAKSQTKFDLQTTIVQRNK